MKILLCRFGKIGNMLLLAPPLITVKFYHQDCEFTFLSDYKYAEVGRMLPGVSKLLSVCSFDYSGCCSFAPSLGGTSYDVAFDFQATPESSERFRRVRAKRIIGFDTENTQGHSYSETVRPSKGQSLSESYYLLFKCAWPELPESHYKISRLRSGKVRRIGLAPGGSAPRKRWPCVP